MDDPLKRALLEMVAYDPIDDGGEVVFGEGMIGIAGEEIHEGEWIEVDLSVPPHRRVLRPIRKD